SIWYLVRGQPLLVQGEVDATQFDMAARVDGRVAEIPVVPGQDVSANAVLVKIDNPETLAQKNQALAAEVVAGAQLAHLPEALYGNVGSAANKKTIKSTSRTSITHIPLSSADQLGRGQS